MDSIMEQPPIVLAGAALALVIVVAVIINSQSSAPAKQAVQGTSSSGSKSKASKKKNKKKSQKAASTSRDLPVVEEPKPAASSSKKKKSKKKAPEPAPAPEPEPAVVEEESSSKKKKKKKNKKKKAATPAPAPAKEVTPEVTADEEDSDSDDDELAVLLNKRQLAKAQGNKKKKEEKKKQEDSWVMVNKGANKDAEAPEAPAKDVNAILTITLAIEATDKPVLLGPKGTTIQGITQESGARLDIDLPVLKITGTQAAIDIAKGRVQTLLTESREEKRRATAHSTTMKGKQIKGSDGVKAIIGKGGSTIQSIQTKTGCKLDANVEKGQVVITGPTEDQVSQAATLCKHAVFGESQDVIELKSVGMVMVVYGKEFQKIRTMQTESGAKLDIEKGTTTLKLSGPTEAVAKARQMVTSWMEYCKGESIEIEANKVGAVYGKGGTTVRRIQDRTGAFIEVDDKGKKGKDLVPCKILGEPEAVKQAKELVLKALDGEIELKPGEIMEKMDLEVGAPAVIGRGGTKIRELEKTFSVKLVVNGDSGICRIAGKKEDVAKAKTEIESIVAPLMEEKRIKAEADRLAAAAEGGASAGPWGGNLDDGADGW